MFCIEKIFVYIIMVMVMVMVSCSSFVCEHMQTRCHSNVSQICDSSGQWQDVIDCNYINPNDWKCTIEDSIHICVPIEVEYE